MVSQSTHTSNSFKSKIFPVVLVCDGIHGPANIGAIFRISEAMGVQEIIFCGEPIDFKSSRMKKTARNTQKCVTYKLAADIISELDKLKASNYQLLALEIASNSVPIQDLSLTRNKVALIIGNEQLGISEAALRTAEQVIHIEMYGQNSSMNVVHATGIALHTIVNTLK